MLMREREYIFLGLKPIFAWKTYFSLNRNFFNIPKELNYSDYKCDKTSDSEHKKYATNICWFLSLTRT